MAKAHKTKFGKWRVQLYIGKNAEGKNQYKSFTADTKKEAEYLAAQYALTLKESLRDLQLTRITLDAAMTEWINNRRNILSPSTSRMYDSMQRCAYESIRLVPVVSITRKDVQSALNDYAASHSPKSVRNAYGLLRSVLTEYSPTLNLDKLNLPQKEERDVSVPDNADVKAMISYLTGNGDYELLIAVVLAALLGLRRSEICALDKSDFFDNCVSITKALVMSYDNKTFVIKSTKTRAGKRVLRMDKRVFDYILAHAPHNETDRLINMSPDCITRRYRTLAKRFGMSTRFHDLRHYYASFLAALNVPVKSAMRRLGHSTPQTTEKIYQHTLPSYEEQFDETINEHVFGLLS